MVRASRALLQSLGRQQLSSVQAIREHLLPPVAKLSNEVATHGKGSYVWTADGQKHLDMVAAIGALSTGYCHPRIVEAMSKQAGTMIHHGQNLFAANPALIGLLERLLGIMPPQLSRFFFCNSGSEAVDNAVKIARAATGKQNIIAFNGGYHGRTVASMALTTSKTIYRQMYGPLMPGVHIAPYPYCLQCDVRKAMPESDYPLAPPVPPLGPETWTCCGAAERGLDWMMAMHTHPDETAAVIIEPILGEGGFVTPPPGFLAHLRRFCDKHNMLLIMDEVQAGAGRTGKWWGHQHFEDSAPDILVFAKGICSGYPFAGLATRSDLYEHMKPGSMGGTYGANALGCAVASATLDVMGEEGLLQNAHDRGLQLMEGLLALARDERYQILDVRGKGLMCSIELGGTDEHPYNAPYGLAAQVMNAARERGLLVMTAGAREAIRFLPPLTISEAEVSEGLEKFEAALKAVFKEPAAGAD